MMRILKSGVASPGEILSRSFPVAEVGETVAEILRNVRQRGDAALREYTERFDGVVLDRFLVSGEEMEEALGAVSDEFKAVLEKAAENIRRFHSRQRREGYRIENPDGTVLGVKITPIDALPRRSTSVCTATAALPLSSHAPRPKRRSPSPFISSNASRIAFPVTW